MIHCIITGRHHQTDGERLLFNPFTLFSNLNLFTQEKAQTRVYVCSLNTEKKDCKHSKQIHQLPFVMFSATFNPFVWEKIFKCLSKFLRFYFKYNQILLHPEKEKCTKLHNSNKTVRFRLASAACNI